MTRRRMRDGVRMGDDDGGEIEIVAPRWWDVRRWWAWLRHDGVVTIHQADGSWFRHRYRRLR